MELNLILKQHFDKLGRYVFLSLIQHNISAFCSRINLNKPRFSFSELWVPKISMQFFWYSEKATKIWSNLETLKSNFKKKFGQIGLLRISDLHKKECHLRINFNQFSGERCERKQCRHNWHVRSVLLIRHPCGKIVRLSGKAVLHTSYESRTEN